ncbi:MAG: radical SAM protein [Deltaproteobacteria bacterium]|nr:MAG: radical SAM protein [Deltaproteobacteria bacterium]
MIAFGPVPSRRLGRSLGINNIPPKICSYSCIYCQLGRTIRMGVKREAFYKPNKLFKEVEGKVEEAENRKEHIDYLTFVPDGEPTLDINLGREIKKLISLDIKIAVITNSSLLWRKNVRDDVRNADLVSIKIDTVDEKIWRKINRPHPSINLKKILDGILRFRKDFNGRIYTETMLVDRVNDDEKNLRDTADFIAELSADKSYISIPIRPPAEKWVNIPGRLSLNKAYRIFKERGIDVEYLIEHEENKFTSTGDIKEDILSIASVHPIREDSLEELLRKADADWDIVERLKSEKELVEVRYRNKKFYMRNLFKKLDNKKR